MKSLDTIRELAAHMEWADSTAWQSIAVTPAAATDSSVRDRLHHLHLTQQAFLAAWRDVPLGFSARDAAPELAITLQRARAYYASLTPYLQSIEESALDETLNVPWAKRLTAASGREAASTTRGQTILQAILHSTYHRGQVNTRLRELAGEPRNSDYIYWIWLGRPAADWVKEAALGGQAQ